MAETSKQMQHTPVLMDHVLQYLKPRPKENYLDLTAGYGGHAGVIRSYTHGWPVTLVDRDEMAIGQLRERFSDAGAEIIHSDFLAASQQLVLQGRQFDMILADLGVSSPHLNIASRGFSIQHDGPLDMRMDQKQKLTAHQIVNEYELNDLIQIIQEYGEEPRARKIAAAIIRARPIESTAELAKVIASQYFGRSKTHPATKTFQGLRIAVNDELRLLKEALPLWVALLKPGGRLAVISFHSLEDRIVKQFLSERAGNAYDADLTLLTKRPAVADKHEIVSNPRARSAKLRAAAKK
jgi:16S rRNA (cytosine1402-N4)-methyltransferase